MACNSMQGRVGSRARMHALCAVCGPRVFPLSWATEMKTAVRSKLSRNVEILTAGPGIELITRGGDYSAGRVSELWIGLRRDG